jgi:DNA-binding GntR family transcriptional regulator
MNNAGHQLPPQAATETTAPWSDGGPIAAIALADAATYRLREAILDGRLPGGERIVERDVSEAFGLSRGPIRDALRRLETEGLVELLPRRGARVATLSHHDAQEVIALRTAVEPVAVAFSLTRHRAELLADLHAILSRMHFAVEHQDWPAAMLLDLEFHGAVYARSDARRTQRVWEGLRPFLLRAFRLHPQVYGSGADVYESHLSLCRVYETGTQSLAEEATREHVLHLTAEALDCLG